MRLIMPVYKIWEICTYEVITDAFAAGSGIDGNRQLRHPITGFAALCECSNNQNQKSAVFAHNLHVFIQVLFIYL